MAFVLEDGTGLTNSNAYISPTEMTTYHLDRGVEISAQYDDTKKQRAIVAATDYVDLVFGPRMLGRPLLLEQALLFPRQYLYNKNFPCTLVEGIPQKLKNAVAEYALLEMITPGTLLPNPVVSETGLQVDTQYEKVGPIESRIKYLGSAVKTVKPFPKADRWMSDFITGTEGGSYRA